MKTAEYCENFLTKAGIFFDAKDHEFLHMVNMILERDRSEPSSYADKLLETTLHPNGIKELALSHDKRIAYAVIDLLESLEAGHAEDRLRALRALHDEALFGTMTRFRYNTGRVLIQIMKEIIRAHGDFNLQLHLAHDFRVATSGRRRITRMMLKRYHLLEMPESWNQQTFDDHVHDANTKGRKSATHLIMDAWIKGLRSLKVIYYNYVNPATANELLRAAAIMQIYVRIGIAFKSAFHGRYVDIIWQPARFVDNHKLGLMLTEKNARELMQQGQAASLYHNQYIFSLLENYNYKHRLSINEEFGLNLEPIKREQFIKYVSVGQPAVLHLAELIYDQALPDIAALRQKILAALKKNPVDKDSLQKQFIRLHGFSPDVIAERWLSPDYNPDLPNPMLPPDAGDKDAPEILRLSAKDLIANLSRILPSSLITLSLRGLEVQDVLELLYDCEGKITHLELLNLKYFTPKDTKRIESINHLQISINRGSSIALKKQIFAIIHECAAKDETMDLEKLRNILRNIPKLHSYYAESKLKTSIGSDSTSRSGRRHGMGFVWIDTLPWMARRDIKKDLSMNQTTRHSKRQILPFYAEVNSRVTTIPVRYMQDNRVWSKILNKIPLLKRTASYREQSWSIYPEGILYSAEGNLSTLGGIQGEWLYSDEKFKKHAHNSLKTGWQVNNSEIIGPRRQYINITLLNVLKVLIGFIAAMLTFMYTQSWWALAWFGAPLWFAVTGFRNILQAVLGAGGIRHSPLMRWNNFVSRTRLCDSLFFTGLSVPLLELVTNYWFLNKLFSITPSNHPWLFFAIMSLVNGCYIAAHNFFRGFPTSVVIGNIFRSVFAIPVSILYSLIFAKILFFIFLFSGAENAAGGEVAVSIDLLLLKCSSIISKLSSDTIAGLIEGFAERGMNMHIRIGDYKAKIQHLFENFSRLELLLPEEDSVLDTLAVPKDAGNSTDSVNKPLKELECSIVIDSLDFLYFWMYQPRARSALQYLFHTMSIEERNIFCRAQFILTREKEVLELFAEGILGKDFSKTQAFYLAQYRTYLKDILILAGIRKKLPEA